MISTTWFLLEADITPREKRPMKKRDKFNPSPCNGCLHGTSHVLGCRFYGTSIKLSKETWEAIGDKSCLPSLKAPTGPGYWCNSGQGWITIDTATADLCDKYPEKTNTTRITSEEF